MKVEKFSLALLLMALVPSVALAEMAVATESVGDGTCRITAISGSLSSEITFPESVGGLAVSEIGTTNSTPITRSSTGINSLIIPDSVRVIRPYAFRGFENLYDVEFGNGVTNIGGLAFRNCANLTKLFIPASVKVLGGSVFAGCNQLTRIVYLGAQPETMSGYYNGTPAALVSYFCVGSDGWTAGTWNDRPLKSIPRTYTIAYKGFEPERFQTCQYDKVERLEYVSQAAGWISETSGRRYDNGVLIFNLAYPGETNTLNAVTAK